KQQYGSHQGPCLDAIEHSEVVISDDVTVDERWPVFGPAVESTGVKAINSFPLSVRDETLGALNLYSRRVGGFSDDSRAVATLFSSQAAVALANAKTHQSALELTINLQEALKTREVIGEAKGILMAREGVAEDEAFQMLRRASQTTNMKLRDIAQELVHKVAGGDGKVTAGHAP
ncbi:MAG: hypothetical protein QOH90_1493, partial [Actinomycetota bacterium]|nr:hypothetical protein [Actinomycetota bacterium]